MPTNYSAQQSDSSDPIPGTSVSPVTVTSFKKHNGAMTDGFTFDEPTASVPASYYESKDDLRNIIFPPPGTNGSITLNESIRTGKLSNACLALKTSGSHTKYYQPFLLPPEDTGKPLHSTWCGTIPDPERQSERLFAAGYKGGTAAAGRQAGKPDWVVLGEEQPLGLARSLMSGK